MQQLILTIIFYVWLFLMLGLLGKLVFDSGKRMSQLQVTLIEVVQKSIEVSQKTADAALKAADAVQELAKKLAGNKGES